MSKIRIHQSTLCFNLKNYINQKYVNKEKKVHIDKAPHQNRRTRITKLVTAH